MPPLTPTETGVDRLLKRARKDPNWLVRKIFHEDPWSAQQAIISDVFHDPRRQVAVKACTSSGKTRAAADVALAFFLAFPFSKVLTTAPTWTQVEKLLWGDLSKVYGQIPRGLGATLLTTELRFDATWWVMGLSTDEQVKFQGHHAPKMLVIIDEAAGVRADIHAAIKTLKSGGDVHILMLGNPYVTSGPFYDAFTTNRAQWACHTISAFETPNLAGLTIDDLHAMSDAELDSNPRPYLTTRRWVRDLYDEVGPDSPFYQAFALGEFPTNDETNLIPLAWLEAARRRVPFVAADETQAAAVKLLAGIDVAGPGKDETVLHVIDQLGNILLVKAWPQPDPRGPLAAELEARRAALLRTNVDTIGIGYYLGKHLEDLHFPITHVNVGDPPTDEIKFANMKAELYWHLRQQFQEGHVAGLTDDKTIAQLASIRYEPNSRGRTAIESKEKAAKRGVKSPDRAESLMLAFAALMPPKLPFGWMNQAAPVPAGR